MRKHVAARPVLDHPARLQHDHPVGEQQRVERVVGDHDRRRSATPAGAPDEVPLHGDVERRHRLVEQEHPRVRRQGAGNRHPLGLAAGELSRPPVGEVADSDLVEPALGVRACCTPESAAAAWPERDVLQCVEVGEEQGVLAEQRRTPGVRGDHRAGATGADIGERLAVEHHPAGGRAHQPGKDAQQRRLARSVGTEQGEGLAVRDLDGHLDVALGHARAEVDVHRTPRPWRAKPITMTATTSRTRASATAASASVSRCR